MSGYVLIRFNELASEMQFGVAGIPLNSSKMTSSALEPVSTKSPLR